ncbi:MAG: InlB B-repeat-containing protein, partial [Clostridiales bacterium]|nr:InlB B-repeat-containing protein [Clostridiales bacterium]
SNASKPSPAPKQDAYTVDYWYKQGETTPFDFDNTPITGDITLYAHWAVSDYTVSFDLNGWPFLDAIPDKTVAHDGSVADPNVTVPDHYTLVWYNSDTDVVYNFGSAVTGDLDLIAKWTADDGLYANDIFVKAWGDNGTVEGQIRLKAENVFLQAGATLTLRNNNSIITTHVAIRSGAPGASYFDGPIINNSTDGIVNPTKPLKVGATGGWFSLYYDSSSKSTSEDNEKGIWVVFKSSGAELALKANDGVYNGSTKLGGFTQDTDAPYLLVTQEITLSADTTVAVIYNNATVTLAGLVEGSHGTLSNGKVVLGAGKYTFNYIYADRLLEVIGTPDEGYKTGDDDWYIVGTISGWAINTNNYIAANSYVEKEFNGGEQIKVAKANSDGTTNWDVDSYGYNSNCVGDDVGNDGGNIRIDAKGTYIIGFYDNKVYVAKKTETITVNDTLIVVNGKTNCNLWMWEKGNSNHNFTGGTWPGKAFSAQSTYTVDVDVMFIVNNGSAQTGDITLTQNTAKADCKKSGGFTVFTFGGTMSV